MKLLLDEMLPAAVARGLGDRGHDVVAVEERADLRGSTDVELFELAQGAGRAVATYNRDDFLELDRRFRAEGRDHCGTIVLNPRRFPQGRSSTGRLVRAFDALLREGAPYPSFVHWLQ